MVGIGVGVGVGVVVVAAVVVVVLVVLVGGGGVVVVAVSYLLSLLLPLLLLLFRVVATARQRDLPSTSFSIHFRDLSCAVVHRCSASPLCLCFASVSSAGDARLLSAARPCCLQPWSRRLCSGGTGVLCIGSSCAAIVHASSGFHAPLSNTGNPELHRNAERHEQQASHGTDDHHIACCAVGALLRRTVVPCP